MKENILCPNIFTILFIMVKNHKIGIGSVNYRIVGSIWNIVQCFKYLLNTGINIENASNTK